MIKIKRALVSVSDKNHLVPFCSFLKECGVEIVSTGGTAKTLNDNDIPTRSISDLTGFPEMLDGRVKTLHPKVHGGLLGLRENSEHVKTMEEHGIEPIDMVVVNLYPFEEVSNKENTDFAEVIENIDIGGPSMVRSAAKNFQSVAIVTDPAQYHLIMKEMKDSGGSLSYETKKELAQKAYALTSRYDSLIAAYLKYGKPETNEYPDRLNIELEKCSDLRYGENPHQKASFYKMKKEFNEPSIIQSSQLQGKELSFNNILDFDGALSCVKEFKETACVIVKHTNPCGVALGANTLNAFERAWAGDPVSAFGSVIAFNEEVDAETAKAISAYFVEGVIAPDFSSEAREILKAKKNLRLLILPSLSRWRESGNKDFICDSFDYKKVAGGLLVQERDLKIENADDFEVITRKVPTIEEMSDLAFAWKIVKHVKSNAIVYARNKATVGIGAGQMSRVDSAKFGSEKAQSSMDGTVMASDAFFPFRDSIDSAAKVGVTAIVQPGGSIRDQEVIDACNEHDIAMVLTSVRHFRH